MDRLFYFFLAPLWAAFSPLPLAVNYHNTQVPFPFPTPQPISILGSQFPVPRRVQTRSNQAIIIAFNKLSACAARKTRGAPNKLKRVGQEGGGNLHHSAVNNAKTGACPMAKHWEKSV